MSVTLALLSLRRPGSNNSNENSLVELLLPDPRTKSEAFRLGQLEEQLSRAEADAEQGSSGALVDTILRTAAEVIGRSTVSAAELHGTLESVLVLCTTHSACMLIDQ